MKKLLSTSIALFFPHIAWKSVAVSAFSSLHQHAAVPSLLNDCCKHRLQPPSFIISRIHNGMHRLTHAQTSLRNDNINIVATSDANDGSSYYHYLLSQFQGDFDNYNQVIQDRRHGLAPAEGGGHEHIHCTLVPCPQHHDDGTHQDQNQWILAAFYFNGNPRQIFRFRAYKLISPQSNELPVRMKLHTILPHLEQQLRRCSEQPCLWWKEAWNVWHEQDDKEQDGEQTNADEWNQFQTKGMHTMVSPLVGCDVLWDPNWDPSKHSYLYLDEYDDGCRNEASLPTGQSCHATMDAGSKGAIVDSISLIPGKRLLIKDELSLWQGEFWINDRGYDPDAVPEEKKEDEYTNEGDSGGMPFVYGNQRGVPYKLQRVSKISSGNDNENLKQPHSIADLESSIALERLIANSDLEWTLGEHYRTEDLYQKKIQDMDMQ
ncbi:hypothetical protein ACHAXR_007499 [Thalassiosira sp. AJA248-18]